MDRISYRGIAAARILNNEPYRHRWDGEIDDGLGGWLQPVVVGVGGCGRRR
jgi:hypothetical protein